MLDFISDFIRRKKKHPSKEAAEHRTKRVESLSTISSKLAEIEDDLTEKNAQSKCKDFYVLVRQAFKDSLGLKYEATIQEIQAEIYKRGHYSSHLRDEINQFLSEIGLMEYGYPEFRELLVSEKEEKERMLSEYLRDIEKHGEHVKKEIKKKISKIVAESVPHSDRELLLRSMKQFKALLHKIL